MNMNRPYGMTLAIALVLALPLYANAQDGNPREGMRGDGPMMMERDMERGDQAKDGCPMRRGMDMQRGGMMSGPMGGRMMDDGMGPMRGMPDELALSDEQRETMRGIQRDLRRQTWDAQGKLIDEQERLHDLWRANPRDPQAIGEAYARMQQIQRPIIEARVKAMNAVEAALTDEQRETLRELHRRHGSGMGMSGMGMSGMGMGMHGRSGAAMGMHGGRCPMQGGMR